MPRTTSERVVNAGLRRALPGRSTSVTSGARDAWTSSEACTRSASTLAPARRGKARDRRPAFGESRVSCLARGEPCLHVRAGICRRRRRRGCLCPVGVPNDRSRGLKIVAGSLAMRKQVSDGYRYRLRGSERADLAREPAPRPPPACEHRACRTRGGCGFGSYWRTRPVRTRSPARAGWSAGSAARGARF